MSENVPAKKIDLSLLEIKKYICPLASDEEAYFFLKLCEAQGLNPFLREAYLIKYSQTDKATIVTGKDTFTKRADRLPQYDGFKAGIIIVDKAGKISYREGSFLVVGETLLGGWAEVFRKDRKIPFRNEVSLKEYERRKSNGDLMSNWKSMPATMIRKVALVQSLREAFPDEFGGIYSPEEMPVDVSAMPIYEKGKEQDIPAPEHQPEPEPTIELTNPIMAIVSNVEMKEGISKGKPWKLFIIHVGPHKFNTFDTNIADIANLSSAEKKEATMVWSDTPKGMKLEEITLSTEEPVTEDLEVE